MRRCDQTSSKIRLFCTRVPSILSRTITNTCPSTMQINIKMRFQKNKKKFYTLHSLSSKNFFFFGISLNLLPFIFMAYHKFSIRPTSNCNEIEKENVYLKIKIYGFPLLNYNLSRLIVEKWQNVYIFSASPRQHSKALDRRVRKVNSSVSSRGPHRRIIIIIRSMAGKFRPGDRARLILRTIWQ